jgi:predicted nucleotidyltransferase component of viral defense system
VAKKCFHLAVPLSPRQCVELFHLVFLRALVARGDDKALFALKGGANLRLFFGSVRYSEDIDLDVVVMGKGTLKNKVDRLLRAPSVTSPLAARGITLAEISLPKQTETTQRWKVGLRVERLGTPLRTKIEFSRRAAVIGGAYEAVSRDLARTYGLTPFLATHYTAGEAIAQKIRALAGRSEPQARDVFDLSHLLARPETRTMVLSTEPRSHVARAVERALGISFDEYASHVVAYLDPAQADLYAGRETWDAMQEAVVSRLTELG